MAYFANGSEGSILDEQCAKCRVNFDAPCPVLLVQMTYNHGQIGNDGMQTVINNLVNEEGVCQMKPITDNQIDGDG